MELTSTMETDMTARVWKNLLRALSAVTLAACSGDEGIAPKSEPPEISLVAAATNPHNALSAIVTFRADRADSARVVYQSAGETQSATPYYAVPSASGQVAVLGLRPSTTYTVSVEAMGSRTVARSASILVTTGALPDAIQTLRLAGSGTPSPGYTLMVPISLATDPIAYVVIFDEKGEIVWYRAFSGEGWAVEAKQQQNGDITVFLGRSYGWQPNYGRYVQVKPSGEIVRAFTASAPFYTDPHELLLSFSDTVLVAAHLFGYELQRFDLSALGGMSDVLLGVHTIERQTAAGVTEFRWNSAGHFSPGDWPTQKSQTLDVVHPSSLGLDHDGNYVASFQAMDEITKIDSRTGEIIWRFGGRNNQFPIEDDPLGGFGGQHHVQVLSDGHLLLFDNQARTRPAQSRAVEYSLDTSAMVARMVWEYRPQPSVASPIMGSAQRLASGNTLVGFGAAGRVAEVDGDGVAVWEGSLITDAGAAPIQFYRALRVPSLYEYRQP